MTDIELIREYRLYQRVKMEYLVQRVILDGESLERLVRVLQGFKFKPENSLKKIFGTTHAEEISKKQLEDFAKDRGILAPAREQEHLVDAYCTGCMYLVNNYGKACEYITIEKRRRGCPAGAGCTKRIIVRKEKK